MSGHTPGPWYAWDNGDGLIGVGKNYGNQADLFRAKGESKRPKSEDDANMKLAAAAPDLLEALEFLMRVVSNPDCAEGLALGSARSKATAAIARAKGEA